MEENKEMNNENNIKTTSVESEKSNITQEKKEINKAKEAIEWIICIIIAIILAILFRYYIGVPTVVKNVSMKPTLVEGQRLILNRWSRTTGKLPERGDIVTVEEPDEKYLYIKAEEANFENPVAIYNSPDSGWDGFVYNVLEFGKVSFIKRVIGLPGDHIEIKNDKVYINGTEYEEPYLNSTVKTTASQGVFTNIVVPENSVFVMGDNRGDSTDSRHFGCIPLDKIESKVLVRFWPLNLAGKVQ